VYCRLPGDAAECVSHLHTYTDLDFTPTLTWSGVSGATGYVLQVADQPSFSTLAYENTALGAGVFADIASLPSEGLYYWRVRARFANGSFSAWSAVDQFVVDVP